MPEWRWIHTPGHAPGHVSLFREKDGTLISGDAFVTVKQESLYHVLVQEKGINGPPMYLTTDWKAAKASIQKLALLNPTLAVTGHGKPLYEEELAEGLAELIANFNQKAIPKNSYYLDH